MKNVLISAELAEGNGALGSFAECIFPLSLKGVWAACSELGLRPALTPALLIYVTKTWASQELFECSGEKGF